MGLVIAGTIFLASAGWGCNSNEAQNGTVVVIPADSVPPSETRANYQTVKNGPWIVEVWTDAKLYRADARVGVTVVISGDRGRPFQGEITAESESIGGRRKRVSLLIKDTDFVLPMAESPVASYRTTISDCFLTGQEIHQRLRTGIHNVLVKVTINGTVVLSTDQMIIKVVGNLHEPGASKF